MQSKINRITDILRRDDGISGAMHYTEQISWVLFLKFLNDYEENKAKEVKLEGQEYKFVIDEEHRWDSWACPKDDSGKIDLKGARTGDDLLRYVNQELFPYLKKFKDVTQDPKSIKYKIGAIFEYLENRIASGHTLREVLDIIDVLDFQSKEDLFELSHIYETLLQGMGNDGGNAGEFYTPRSVIRAMVEAVDPKVGQTVYDGALGSGGFLIQAFDHMKEQPDLSTKDWAFLQSETFFGNEKTPLAYVMGVMNMILHGIESPNVYKRNT
ncbi:N-6 DNA methylase, partial [Patescibacteria group bacterium]|nr:N-6 DNA methylase [Patescibacteria group bacterium]